MVKGEKDEIDVGNVEKIDNVEKVEDVDSDCAFWILGGQLPDKAPLHAHESEKVKK